MATDRTRASPFKEFQVKFLALFVSTLSLIAQSGTNVQSVTPVRVLAGSDAVTITIKGGGFVSGANVFAGGQSLPTVFIDDGTLQSVIPASLLTIPRTLSVDVMNPGGP